jgi:hypothetical protein
VDARGAPTLRRRTDTPEYEVYLSPRAKKDILVAPSIADQTVERILDFIETTGTFTYGRGRAKKTLAAADILSKGISIATGDRPDLLRICPAGQSLTIEIRVQPDKIDLVQVTSFVI